MSKQSPSPFRRAQVIANLGGDEDLFKLIARIFLAEWPRREAGLREALAQGDAVRLRAAAHELKGAAGNFGAERAVGTARRLEACCEGSGLEEASIEVAALISDVGELVAALRAEQD